MKYLQIYENFGNLDYQRIYMFDYKTSPKFSDFDVIDKSTFLKVENILKDLSRKQLFNFKSQLEISSFFMLDWPMIKWCKSWKEFLDKTWDKNEELNNKCLKFYCKIEGLKYKFNSAYHKVSIIKDIDDYYYVCIRLEGYTKHFKCDQEYGLENCLENELKNTEEFRDLL